MKKVLLVIHNRSELRGLVPEFEQADFEVAHAADGLAGFEAFRHGHPDAVVINLLIPKLPGGELCQRIKADARGAHVPVVLVSGLFKKTDMAERARRRWQADGYLRVPFQPAELVRTVAELIEKFPAPPPPEPVPEPKPMPAVPTSDVGLDELLDRAVASLADTDMVDRSPKVAQINEELASRPVDADAASDPLAELLLELEAAEPSDEEAVDLEPAPTPAARHERQPEQAEGDDDFVREGELSDASVPELLSELYFSHKTGVLELTSQGTSKLVYIDRGRAIYVESESRQESLGQVLMRHGIINEEDLMVSLTNMATYGRRHGDSLVQLGMITPMQLYHALRLQMREKLLNMFQWFEGEFFFDETPFDRASLTVFDLPTPQLVLDGVAEAYNPDTVADMFEEFTDQIVAPTEPPPFDRRELDDDADFWRLLALIDGTRTIAEVIAQSPFDPGRTYLRLYAMLILRMFDRRREPEASDAATPPPRREPPSVVEPKPAWDAEEEEENFVFEDLPEDEIPEPDEAAPPAESAPIDDELVFDFEDDDEAEPELASIAADDLEEELRRFEESDETEDGDDSASEVVRGDYELVAIDQSARADEPVDPKIVDAILELYLRVDNSSHYGILGVDKHAKEMTVKLAYHGIVKKLHEDKLADRLDPELREKAVRVVQAVTAAYEVLSSPKKRAEYDRRLTGGGDELKERRITTILAAERAFNHGMLALRRQAHGDAEKNFAEAAELFPEEAEYHAYLGWAQFNNPIYSEKDRPRLAKESVERSLKINPKGDKAYFFLGKILLTYGQKDKAKQMFAMAFRYNRNNDEARNELRRLQADRERERAELQAHDESEKIGNLLRKDLDFTSVKRALRKLFL